MWAAELSRQLIACHSHWSRWDGMDDKWTVGNGRAGPQQSRFLLLLRAQDMFQVALGPALGCVYLVEQNLWHGSFLLRLNTHSMSFYSSPQLFRRRWALSSSSTFSSHYLWEVLFSLSLTWLANSGGEWNPLWFLGSFRESHRFLLGWPSKGMKQESPLVGPGCCLPCLWPGKNIPRGPRNFSHWKG